VYKKQRYFLGFLVRKKVIKTEKLMFELFLLKDFIEITFFSIAFYYLDGFHKSTIKPSCYFMAILQ
jgi:hypothetical protein